MYFLIKDILLFYRDNLIACKTCERTFAEDRIGYHEKICVKVVNMKRKKFDAMTFRIKGTELEPFAKKGLTKKQEVSIFFIFIDLLFYILLRWFLSNSKILLTFELFDSQYKYKRNKISIL